MGGAGVDGGKIDDEDEGEDLMARFVDNDEDGEMLAMAEGSGCR